MKISPNEVIDALCALSGGQARCLEGVISKFENFQLDDSSLAVENATPLLTLARAVSMDIAARYSAATDMHTNALLVSVYAPQLHRDDMIVIDPESESPQLAENAVAAGGIFDASLPDQINNNIIIPCLPLAITLFLDEMAVFNAVFKPVHFETFIAQWLQLWFKARDRCLNGILTGKVLELLSKKKVKWRPFAPLFDILEYLSDVDMTPLTIQEEGFSKLPGPDAEPGIYLPSEENYPSLDIAIVLRKRDGTNMLITIDSKFAVFDQVSDDMMSTLSRQYKGAYKQMKAAKWKPGNNAAFLGVVKGNISEHLVSAFTLSCPHGRLLYGDALRQAMGPTVTAMLDHWPVLSATVVPLEKREAQVTTVRPKV
jgi:hypothetical protein